MGTEQSNGQRLLNAALDILYDKRHGAVTRLAYDLGMNRVTVQKMVSGDRTIEPRTVRQVAALLYIAQLEIWAGRRSAEGVDKKLLKALVNALWLLPEAEGDAHEQLGTLAQVLPE